MRAVAQNQRAARLMGISVERVYSSSWILASVVGAVAGVLIAPVVFLSSKMGLVAINGFTAAVWGLRLDARRGGRRHAARRAREPGAPLPAASIKHSVPFLVMITILIVRSGGLSDGSRSGRSDATRRPRDGAVVVLGWPWAAPRYFVFLASLIVIKRDRGDRAQPPVRLHEPAVLRPRGLPGDRGVRGRDPDDPGAGAAGARGAPGGRPRHRRGGLRPRVPCLRLEGLYLAMATLAFGFVVVEAILTSLCSRAATDGLHVPVGTSDLALADGTAGTTSTTTKPKARVAIAR